MNKNTRNILRLTGIVAIGTVIAGAIVSRMGRQNGCTAFCRKCGDEYKTSCNCPKCGHILDCLCPKCSQLDSGNKI